MRYDSKGDRLIFLETNGPQVIDLASFISGGGENQGKKKLTSTVEKGHRWTVNNGVCCFAGANDELVVAALLAGTCTSGLFLKADSTVAQSTNRLCISLSTTIKRLPESSTINTAAHWFHMVRVISSRHGLLSNCRKFQPKTS